MDGREAANRAAREHLERMRERLAAGRDEIDRQKGSIADTREHISGIQRWLDETYGRRDSSGDE
jgi:predicted  nucleic acid-binding Zn-ribbon protein